MGATRSPLLKPSTIVVGLTGSIGSGKSQAADIFKECGAQVIDADVLAREAVLPGTKTLERIRRTFGDSIINSSGELNRKALGEIVFSDAQLRKQLEDILHPRIREIYLEKLEQLIALTPAPEMLVYVVPLLFESRYGYPEVDTIVVVSAPKELCLKRIMERDSSTRALAENKYAAQIPIEEKERRAGHVIYNDSTLESLRKRIKDLYAKLLKEKQC